MIRDSCVVCGSRTLLHVYKQPEYPLCISSSERSIESDKFGDIDFVGCVECGCIQLINLIDPSILYEFTHNNTYETPTWAAHHSEFSRFILEHTNEKNFIEVGGATGHLIQLLKKERPISTFTVIDLAEKPETIKDIEYRQANCEDFDFTKVPPSTPILLSHVFEHLYNPRKFLKNLEKANTQTVFLSVPNMRVCLEKEFLSFLHVEHTYYCEEGHIMRMFYEVGYTCKKIRLFRDHSLFFWFERGSTLNVPVYPDARKIISLFNAYYTKRDAFYKSIELKCPTYIVPAGHYGQLVYFYLRNHRENIVGFLDNDKSKVGKRVYGTEKLVYNVSHIQSQKDTPISVFLNAGPYNKELKEQLRQYHPAIEFIDPNKI